MAYSTSNPPALALQSINGPRKWDYSSTDTLATVDTSGYITNGGQLGMQVGDIVFIRDTTTPASGIKYVITVSASTGAVDLVDGLVITATNTD